MNLNKKIKNSNKVKYGFGILIFLLVIGLCYLLLIKKDNSTPVTSDVNYNPPTQEEQSAADIQKQDNVQRENIESTPKPANSPAGDAQVVLVDANQYGNIVEARAYVANKYEDDGSCTLTLTHGSEVITKTTKSFKDAKTTQCTPFSVDRSELKGSGSWTAKINYKSEASTGESRTQEFSVN
jgi:hypothetical protein